MKSPNQFPTLLVGGIIVLLALNWRTLYEVVAVDLGRRLAGRRCCNPK